MTNEEVLTQKPMLPDVTKNRDNDDDDDMKTFSATKS